MAVSSKEEALKKVKGTLSDAVLSWDERSSKRIYVEIKPEALRDAVTLVFNELGARFQIATGTDTGEEIEILYHWAFDSLGFVLSLRVKLDRDEPVVDSVADICTGVEFIEREIWELLGVEFKGHPDMRHLLLRKDWPEGKYPLRKDYRGLDGDE